MKIVSDLPQERELIKYTIILTRPLPKEEIKHSRWYVDGVKLNTERMIRLLKKAGHCVEQRDEVCLTLPVKYKGIKIVCRNGGLMVYPKNKLNFNNLKKQLIRDGYFYHSCYLPAK